MINTIVVFVFKVFKILKLVLIEINLRTIFVPILILTHAFFCNDLQTTIIRNISLIPFIFTNFNFCLWLINVSPFVYFGVFAIILVSRHFLSFHFLIGYLIVGDLHRKRIRCSFYALRFDLNVALLFLASVSCMVVIH